MSKKATFSIHPKTGSGLIIQVNEVEEANHSIKWLPHSRKLYRDTILPICNGKEKELFKLLMECELKHSRMSSRRESVDTMDFSLIHVDAKDAIAILKEIFVSGTLYFERKELLANFFGKATLSYHFEEKEDGLIFLRKIVKTPSKEFELSDCSIIARGTPHWGIRENTLFFFHEDLSWQWLSSSKAKELLNRQEFTELIEELEEEKEIGAPLYTIKERSKHLNVPLPIIALSDHTGAFANLWFDYGNGQKVLPDSPKASWRDLKSESSFKKDLIEGGFQEKRVGISHYYCPIDQVKGVLQFFIEMGWQVFDTFSKIVNKDFSSLKIPQKPTTAADQFLDTMKEEFSEFDPNKKITLGKAFQGTLRNYQQLGVNWLSFLYHHQRHGILADDMGLGKTVQVIAFLSTLTKTNPVLIVAPTSLLFHWKLEFQKFLPSYSIYLHYGSERKEDQTILSQYDVILTSYALLKRDLPLLQSLSFSSIFLDEAQAIKNADTLTAKAACAVNAHFRLSITGTPIENHLGELLSQFKFLMPTFFQKLENDYKSFKKDSPEILRKLRRQLRPFILRRRKSDVDEQLPEKIEQTVWLEMEPEQRILYDSFHNQLKDGLLKKIHQEGAGKHRMEIFEAILRLRQICCDPLLLGPLAPAPPPSSAKFETLFEELDVLMEEGQKVLVYSQFTSMLKKISKKCEENNWAFSYLDGSTKDREGAVRNFQENPDTKLFLISLKAGGVGLNLTKADYVILYEPWWNEAVENQAIDRAHRIGRHTCVIAKRYIIRGSIEERMMLLKEKKRSLVDSLFDEEPAFEIDDFEFLLT